MIRGHAWAWSAVERSYAVDFPTLWVVPAWIERHCIVPDGFRKSRPFRMYDWQLFCTASHYRVREDAVQTPGYRMIRRLFLCCRRRLCIAGRR